MNDTPRTDATAKPAGHFLSPDSLAVYADFARELERDLIAKDAEIARLKAWNQERAGQFACTEQRLASQIAKLEEQLENEGLNPAALSPPDDPPSCVQVATDEKDLLERYRRGSEVNAMPPRDISLGDMYPS